MFHLTGCLVEFGKGQCIYLNAISHSGSLGEIKGAEDGNGVRVGVKRDWAVL